jgi:hypothetical protein
MTDNQGRVASVLRVVVILLLAGLCYQLGYDAGFTNGNWTTRRQQLWEAVERTGSAAAAEPDAPNAAIPVDLENLDSASAPNGIVMCPPVVLRRVEAPATPDHASHAARTPHSLATASPPQPRS